MTEVRQTIGLLLLVVGAYALFGAEVAGLLALLVAALLLEERPRAVWGIRVASFLFLFAVLSLLQTVLLPFVVGGLLGFLVSPLVQRLAVRGVPRSVGAVVILLLLILGLAALSWGLVVQMVDETNRLLARISEAGIPWEGWLSRAFPAGFEMDLTRLSENLLGLVQQMGQNLFQNLKTLGLGIGTLTSQVFYLLISFIVAYYVAVDGPQVERALQSTLARHFPDAEPFLEELGLILRRYFRGQLLVAAILGTYVGIALEILGFSSGILIGAMVAITNLIPNIGFWIAFLPALFFGLLESEPLMGLLKILGVFATNQILETAISPRIIGGSVQLHPLLVLLSILVGAKFFGVLGLLLAVPVAATLKVYAGRMRGLFATDSLQTRRPPQSRE